MPQSRPCKKLFTAPSICPRVLPHTAHSLARFSASALPRHSRRGHQRIGGATAAKGAHGIGFNSRWCKELSIKRTIVYVTRECIQSKKPVSTTVLIVGPGRSLLRAPTGSAREFLLPDALSDIRYSARWIAPGSAWKGRAISMSTWSRRSASVPSSLRRR